MANQILILGVLLLAQRTAFGVLGCPPTLMKPEDIADSPVLVVAKIEKMSRPRNSGVLNSLDVEYLVKAVVRSKGAFPADAKIRHKQLPADILSEGRIYLFAVRQGSEAYAMKDWLLPLPITEKNAETLSKNRLKAFTLETAAEILRAQSQDEDAKIAALSLLQIGSLGVSVSVPEIRLKYFDENTLLALSALYCGLSQGDPDALEAVVSLKSPYLRDDGGWLRGRIETAVTRFPSTSLGKEVLVAAMTKASPQLRRSLLELAQKCAPDVAIPVALVGLSDSDIHVSYGAVRSLIKIYDVKGELRVGFSKFKENPQMYIEKWRRFLEER